VTGPTLPALGAGPAFVAFLCAAVAEVSPAPEVGSVWRGHLRQLRYAFPTKLTITERQGNAFQAEMEQDFASLFGGRRTPGRISFLGDFRNLFRHRHFRLVFAAFTRTRPVRLPPGTD
jgi:hypothetical protein